MSKFLHFCYGTADSFGKRFFPKLLVFSVFLGFFHIRSVPLRLCRPEVRILPGTPKSPENTAFSGLSLFSAIVLLLYTQFIELFALVYIFIDKFCRLEPFTAFLLQFTLYISIAVTAIWSQKRANFPFLQWNSELIRKRFFSKILGFSGASAFFISVRCRFDSEYRKFEYAAFHSVSSTPTIDIQSIIRPACRYRIEAPISGALCILKGYGAQFRLIQLSSAGLSRKAKSAGICSARI